MSFKVISKPLLRPFLALRLEVKASLRLELRRGRALRALRAQPADGQRLRAYRGAAAGQPPEVGARAARGRPGHLRAHRRLRHAGGHREDYHLIGRRSFMNDELL